MHDSDDNSQKQIYTLREQLRIRETPAVRSCDPHPEPDQDETPPSPALFHWNRNNSVFRKFRHAPTHRKRNEHIPRRRTNPSRNRTAAKSSSHRTYPQPDVACRGARILGPPSLRLRVASRPPNKSPSPERKVPGGAKKRTRGRRRIPPLRPRGLAGSSPPGSWRTRTTRPL